MKIKNILLTLCTSLLLTNVAAHAKEVKIGMAIDDLRLERWQKDRDIFVKKAESLGAKVFVQSANGNEETQMSQIENMINRGVDVLVIIPYNGQVLSNVVKEAGFAPIFPDICYHLTHYKPAAADIPVASDNPAHYADAIRYNARTPLQGSLLPLTRLVWA